MRARHHTRGHFALRAAWRGVPRYSSLSGYPPHRRESLSPLLATGLFFARSLPGSRSRIGGRGHGVCGGLALRLLRFRQVQPAGDHALRLFDAAALEAGEQLRRHRHRRFQLLGIGLQHLAGLAQGLGVFAVGELVGLGQQHVDRSCGRQEPLDHLAIEFRERPARIHHQDQAGELLAGLHVIAQQALPVVLGRARDLGIAVAGQVDQERKRVGRLDRRHREIVDVLGAPGRARRERQPLLVTQDVDGRGLAGVGAAGERDLGHGRGGQVAQVVHGDEEAGLVKKGHALERWGGPRRPRASACRGRGLARVGWLRPGPPAGLDLAQPEAGTTRRKASIRHLTYCTIRRFTVS
ncbi:hypothetical protein CBM2634_A260065 [Cupriavidus taiwanensis]|uniref:Uncharacterized protein n=1 Tax=Cupriavidus taiwanensis TaxID=164546 RepID=A0A375J2V4_9BURK|nr:hypothetical protein CBM2634_A260065 [Cupriavidus taiwanensis]